MVLVIEWYERSGGTRCDFEEAVGSDDCPLRKTSDFFFSLSSTPQLVSLSSKFLLFY